MSFSNSAKVTGGVEAGLEHRPGIRVWVRVPIHNHTEHRYCLFFHSKVDNSLSFLKIFPGVTLRQK